jgi:hypothetical protein
MIVCAAEDLLVGGHGRSQGSHCPGDRADRMLIAYVAPLAELIRTGATVHANSHSLAEPGEIVITTVPAPEPHVQALDISIRSYLSDNDGPGFAVLGNPGDRGRDRD